MDANFAKSLPFFWLQLLRNFSLEIAAHNNYTKHWNNDHSKPILGHGHMQFDLVTSKRDSCASAIRWAVA